MNKNFVKNLFKLDEIVNILKVMDEYKEVTNVNLKNLAINDNVYDVVKSGDSLVIKDHHNGTGIGIAFKYTESDNIYMFYNDYDLGNYHFYIDYRFQNGHNIKLDGDLCAVGNSLKYITSYDLMDNLKITYGTDKDTQVKFNWKLEPGNLKMTNEGPSLNGILVDPEEDRIVSINGVEVPSLEEIAAYNSKDAEEKLNDELFAEVVELQKNENITTIEDSLKYLERKDAYLSKCEKDYRNALKRVKILLATRACLMEDLDLRAFASSDLDLIGDILEDESKVAYEEKKKNEKVKVIAKRLGSN